MSNTNTARSLARSAAERTALKALKAANPGFAAAYKAEFQAAYEVECANRGLSIGRSTLSVEEKVSRALGLPVDHPAVEAAVAAAMATEA
jgi:hypothetical protein